MSETEDDCRFVEEHGTFAIGLTPPTVRWHYDVTKAQPAHQTVLLPLLRRASECLAYGIRENGRVWTQCSEILNPAGRRHRVDLSNDPVTDFPLLWNVVGGERGSIVILATFEAIDLNEYLPHCYAPYTASNFRAAHNDAAVRCARKHAAAGNVAFCLPRNNGIEWMDIFAPPTIAAAWYLTALQLCKTE